MRIVMIRHGQSASNTGGCMYARADMPLTFRGRQQAQASGEELYKSYPKGFDRVFSSDMLRALQTAELATMFAPSITVTPLLREMDIGALEGLPWADLAHKHPDIDYTNLSKTRFPGGEDCAAVQARFVSFCSEYLSRVDNDESVLIASHGCAMRVFINTLLARPMGDIDRLNSADNGAFTEIELDKKTGAAKILRLNERHHLLSKGLGAPDYNAWAAMSENAYLIEA